MIRLFFIITLCSLFIFCNSKKSEITSFPTFTSPSEPVKSLPEPELSFPNRGEKGEVKPTFETKVRKEIPPPPNIRSQLKNGVLVFRIPLEMTVGQTYRAEVRIDDSITMQLTENLEGHQPVINVINGISSTMRVTLIGKDFRIVPLTSEIQLRKIDRPTIWLWDVVPEKAGKQILVVRASAILKCPGYTDETYDYDTIEEHVIVTINTVNTLTSWIVKNWLASLLTIVVTTMIGYFTVRKEKSGRDKKKERKSGV